MRPRCGCGAIACYWYAPKIYTDLSYESWLTEHAYCEKHADTNNPAEYRFIGFHKKDWRWLNINKGKYYAKDK